MQTGVAARTARDRRLEIVGGRGDGDAAIMPVGVLQTAQEGLGLLIEGGFTVARSRATQHRPENMRATAAAIVQSYLLLRGTIRRGLRGSQDHNGILRMVGNQGLVRWNLAFTEVLPCVAARWDVNAGVFSPIATITRSGRNASSRFRPTARS